MLHASDNSSRRGRGFTLIELLVTISIITILIGIIVVALGRALRAGEKATSQFQVNAIGTATESFRTDFNYVPPLLTPETSGGNLYNFGPRGSYIVPQEHETNFNNLSDLLEDNRYASEFTMGVYLLGVGDLDGSTGGPADNSAEDDGKALDGIRSPGRDRSWGGAADRADHEAETEGQVYGPYLDAGTIDLEFVEDTGLYRILDVSGNAVRYYKGFPTKVRSGDTPNPHAYVPDSPKQFPSVQRVPVELRSFESVEFQVTGDGTPDLSLDSDLLSADFAVLAANGDPFERNGQTFAPFGDRLPVSGQVAPVLVDVDGGWLSTAGDDGEEWDLMIEFLKSNARYVSQ